MTSRAPAVLGGVLAGFAGGLFGVGGGIILVPILTARFHLSQHQAHGTSLAVLGATAVVAVAVYALHGNVAWLTALIVAPSSILSARWGARLAARTPAARLTQGFAVFLMAVGLRLLWRVPHATHALVQGPTAIGIELVIGLMIGLVAGYMGVGGGVIAVPAFTLLLGMPQQLAQGTSLAVILVTAPSGAWEHHRHGNVEGGLVLPMAVGAAIGAPIASFLVQRISSELLTRAFAVFVMINAVLLWVRAGRKAALRAAA